MLTEECNGCNYNLEKRECLDINGEKECWATHQINNMLMDKEEIIEEDKEEKLVKEPNRRNARITTEELEKVDFE